MLTILISTYNRPELLLNLLRDIDAQAEEKVRVCVYDDASTEDYSEVQTFLAERDWSWHSEEENHGKAKHAEFVGKIFAEQKRRKGPFLFLPDDVRLRDNFFPRMQAAWDSVEDRKKACMRVLVSERRRNVSSWSGKRPESASDLVDNVWFFDGAALLDRAFFKALNYTVPDVDPGMARAPGVSSGMGKAISKKLVAKGLGMYRVKESLVTHVAAKSQMHPSKRLEDTAGSNDDPMDQKYLAPVYAALASIPERVELLRKTVESLEPQVTKVHVFLNGYDSVPSFLQKDNVVVARSQDHGDLTDSGKFFWADKVEGYYFTCDDDIIYPSDYVETLVGHIEARDRKAVVTLHGRLMPTAMPIKSYYRDKRIKIFHNQWSQAKDELIHVGGSGVMAFHTDALDLSIMDFKAPRMADVWVSVAAAKQDVPMVCIRHKAKWVTLQKAPGIFQAEYSSDAVQTQAVNETQWPGTALSADPLQANLRAVVSKSIISWDKEAKTRNRMAAVFPEWNSRDYGKVRPLIDKFVKQMLQETVIPGGKILDFGCGWGRWQPMLAAFGDYCGIDASEKMVELATNRHGTVPGVHHRTLDHHSAPFNTLFAFDVLRHLTLEDRAKLRALVEKQGKKTRSIVFEVERTPRDLAFVNNEFPWLDEVGSLRVGGMLIRCFAGKGC